MDLLAGTVSAIIPWNKITGKVLAQYETVKE